LKNLQRIACIFYEFSGYFEGFTEFTFVIVYFAKWKEFII